MLKIYNKKTGEEIDIKKSDNFRDEEKIVFSQKELGNDVYDLYGLAYESGICDKNGQAELIEKFKRLQRFIRLSFKN